MSARALIGRGRAAAVALMVDGCVIARPAGGAPVLSAVTGGYTQPTSQIYAGPCRVKPRDNADRVVDAGGQAVSLFPYVVSVPIGAERYEVDDLVTVTASELDPSLPGLVLRVQQVGAGTHLTARRLSCEVNAG